MSLPGQSRAQRSPLQDPEAIQIGYMQVIHAVVEDRIGARQARLVLSALRDASANVGMSKLGAQLEAGVRSVPKRRPAAVDAAVQCGEKAVGR